MTDQPVSPAAAPSIPAAPSPVAAAPAPSSAVVVAATAPSPAPVVANDAVVSAPAEVAKPADVSKPAEVSKPSTLLDAPVAKPVEVPADAKVEAKTDTKQVEGQSDKPAQLPTYEAFKLPEGVTFDNQKLSEFVKELGELQGKTKSETAVMQEFGQKLVDRHVAELQRVVKQAQEQVKADRETQVKSWDEAFRKDPELGGNKQDTTLNVARSAMKFAGNEAQQKEFRQLLQDTGAYAHPAMIRTLANFQNKINELEAKYNSEGGIKPLVATAPTGKPKGISDKMYGNMK